MGELWQMGACELAAAIRDGSTSSREALDALRQRIAAVNGSLNAVVADLGDEATAAATEADRAVAAGDPLGPFHGVPISVKENIDVAGWPTTHGVPAFADATSAVDAPIVERMRAAGAFPFVRTNLPDFGLRVHTDSSLHGLTRNPWHPDLTAGGSSGGDASALAAGMSPLGLGNDLGGSLRNPAHCCGIASIKPSTGVVPDAASLPPEDPLIMFQLMAVQGVMARHVGDVVAGLRAAAGVHARDPLSLPIALTPPVPGTRLRVAVLTDPPGGTTDPGIEAAIRRTADVLSDEGHEVDDAEPETYARCIELWAELLMPDIAAVRPMLDLVLGPDGQRFLDAGVTVFVPADTSAWAMLFAERHRCMRDWTTFFQRWDVLLTPTWTSPAFPHGFDVESVESGVAVLEALRPVLPANLLGLPAAVAPCGLADGLPVGAQFTSARFADLTALAAAQALEDRVGVFTPIDPVLALP